MMIRRAGPDDVELVKELRLSALADAPSAYATTLQQDAALHDDVWRRRLQPDQHPTFVWEDDDGPQGMVVGLTDEVDRSVAYLVAMWVRPSARGAGVGDALVTRVLSWAQESAVGAVRLRVTIGNDRAERLYARHGFSRTGRTERRERDGLNEFEMEARFAPRASDSP